MEDLFKEREKMKEKIKEQDFDCSYGILVMVSKNALEEAGVLNEYLKIRGKNVFADDDYDYITIFQAKLIGLIK